MKKTVCLILLCIISVLQFCACDQGESAANNKKLNATVATTTVAEETADNSVADENATTAAPLAKTWSYSKDEAAAAGYDCDISADLKSLGNIDCKVPDNLYSTTINDWYANFDSYEGQVVEIEGYYITDSKSPYTWIGRKGPDCEYCANGFVCFEFYTNSDLSELKTDCTDWITVIGILRSANDGSTDFQYIEALSVEKTPEGQGTITN